MSVGTAVAAIVMGGLWPAAVAAHGPDPVLGGGLFAQNQALLFDWRSGSAPPAVFKTAIKAAATAANATRASKAATFTYDADGTNPIGYGLGATCGVNGLACFTRNAPKGFTMWLREQGHRFDWGTLKWCESYANPPNGCYDAMNVALDEFGHVEGLGHHVNHANDDDYSDAVVQTFSRTKPSKGYNAHKFGRCDIATLQREYDVLNSSTKYSTCLDLTTELTLAVSSASVAFDAMTTFTATLRVADLAAYKRMGGNGVTGRTVELQRRTPGTTTWQRVATMPAGSAAGAYTYGARLRATYDYRAVFKTPTDEGLNGDTSGTARVTVGPCPGTVCVL